MSAHTPGPWHFDDTCEYYNQPVIRMNGCIVAAIPPARQPVTDEERAANAQLIAAAPDLLDALQILLGRYISLVTSGDCGNWDPAGEAEVISALSAITKAEGRQA